MVEVRDEVGVYEYSGGIIGPGIAPAATVRNGGIIRTGTPLLHVPTGGLWHGDDKTVVSVDPG